MTPNDKLSEKSTQELISERAKIKTALLTNAVMVGVLIGIAIYSTYTNGLSILTFFPLLFIPMFAKKAAGKKAIDKELKNRNVL